MSTFAAFLANLPRPVDLFFRDDDAGWEHARLKELVALFAGHGLPLDLAVIPAVLDHETADDLARLRARNPLLGFHQHGYAHVNHEPASERKCEFGPARPHERQLADIIAGRLRLDAMLGEWDRIFTPPWNRCAPATCASLAGHGFALLSTDRHRIERGGIAELPVALDWERARREGRLELTLREVLGAAAGPVGIMLHHSTMDNDARRELASVLDNLASSPTIRCRPMRHWIGHS